MDPPVTLRPATAGDAPFLAAVYASTRMDELELTDWDPEQKNAFCQMQSEAQAAHYRQHYLTAEYFVIETADCQVGRLYLDRWAREIRIMDIAILPAHRGRGIGTRLLRGLQQEATRSGKCLSIHVERLNPALGLYQRIGFQVTVDKGVYLLMEWKPTDGLM
jgi:ribosomal protein S18 acetylase RimI-like enzyme